MDELIAKSNSTMDTEEQKAAFKEIQQYVAENALALPLYHQVCFIYTSDDLDTAGSEFGNDQFSYEKNILDWNIARDDKTLYTNGGPQEFFWYPMVNPGYMINTELVFDKLINADSSLNPTDGMLAETYTVSEDGKSIEFCSSGRPYLARRRTSDCGGCEIYHRAHAEGPGNQRGCVRGYAGHHRSGSVRRWVRRRLGGRCD